MHFSRYVVMSCIYLIPHHQLNWCCPAVGLCGSPCWYCLKGGVVSMFEDPVCVRVIVLCLNLFFYDICIYYSALI